MGNKRICILFVACMVILSSCKKSFINEVSNDPNNPTDVPLKLLLPAAEVSVGLVYGSELAWYSNIFMQQQAGVTGQMAAADKYNVLDADLSKPWADAYANAMTDLNIIISKAEKDSSTVYAGIAKVLMAATLGQVTDCWGDVPYSQAFKGSENQKPSYDSQESIYNAIQSLLSEALIDLKTESKNMPGSDDLIYSGDASLWISTAHILQARYHNHLSKIDPAGSAQKTLEAIDAGIYADVSQDAQCLFGTSQPSFNPWYQFSTQKGLVRMGKYLVDYMNTTVDPRLPLYAEKNGMGQYSGSEAGNPQLNASIMGLLYASMDSKVPLVTYMEAKFIEAEAALRTGNKDRAATAFNDGVKASLDKAGVSGNVFVNTYANENATSITLEKIMTQKYVAMFSQMETWTDYRRTNFPALLPANGNYTNGIVPTRLIYPLNEKNFNSANVPVGFTLTSRVWWDKQ